MIRTFLCAIALVSASAHASDWRTAFDPSRVGSYFRSDHFRILVAASGEDVHLAREAGYALSAALRACGNADLVMSDGTLGDLSSLSDQDIVEKSMEYPVDLIAVVRLDPDPPTTAPSVEVMIFDKRMNLIAAIEARDGIPIHTRYVQSTLTPSPPEVVRMPDGFAWAARAWPAPAGLPNRETAVDHDPAPSPVSAGGDTKTEITAGSPSATPSEAPVSSLP